MTKIQAKQEPHLRFREGIENAGFSSSTTSNAADADATTIIRELIQNSVDAAKEVDKDKSVIKFQIENIEQQKYLGINQLRDAFPKALKTQKELNGGELPDVQKQIASNFEESLKREKGYILSILDNGVGLTKRTMQALLSDGQSAKSSAGGGAHGYGHLTVIPASGIRFIYYGGIHKEEGRIASGHCILASFRDDNNIDRTKDGYFVEELNQDLFDPYKFATGANIPALISEKIDLIENEWDSGSVVIIPAFNFFKEEKENSDSIWELIEYAAATNFFASIADGKIVIEFEYDEVKKTLNNRNIEEVLAKHKDERRAKFISGSQAYECLEALKRGEDIEFKTDSGNISGKLLTFDRGKKSRIDLCRNGMWIAYNANQGKLHSKIQNNVFNDYESFHLVLLLEASDGEIHQLVRAAEPPIHDQVDIRRLQTEDQAKLKTAFQQIQEQIKDRLTLIDTNTTEMDGILSLPLGGSKSGGEYGNHAGEWKPFERRQRASSGTKNVVVGKENTGDIGKEKNKKKTNKGVGGAGTQTTPKRAGNAIDFHAIPVPLGPRKYEIEIHPLGDTELGEIRFMVDQNMDETCHRMNDEPFVKLKNATLNGKSISKENLKKNTNGDTHSVLLSDLKEGSAFRIKFDFDLPEDLRLAADKFVGLKAEIIRRKKLKSEDDDD